MNYEFINARKFFNQANKTVSLYKNLWSENTTALLHAPRIVDKTSLAVAIADEIASKGREVLYVNAEGRIRNHRSCSDKLLIYNPEFESIDDKTDYADLIVSAIEHAVRNTSIRTFVIDSVTRIAALSFGRNASVAYVMKRLVALQVKCKLSILVVADDSTKTVNNTLLTLAATEIPIDKEEIVQQETFAPSAPIGRPTINPLANLTRQQRRALARREGKPL